MRSFKIIAAGLLVGLATAHPAVAGTKSEEAQNKQAAVVGGELSAIAKHLATRPETAIDLTGVSGEYCFNAGIGSGGNMTHYAEDPGHSHEDVIDFVRADVLIDAGINVADLPPFPGGMGSMTPNQWYFLAAGEPDPHHGMAWPFPLMMRASSLE
jgi:hypothetical protein